MDCSWQWVGTVTGDGVELDRGHVDQIMLREESRLVLGAVDLNVQCAGDGVDVDTAKSLNGRSLRSESRQT